MLNKTASPAEYCLSLAKFTAFLHKSCQKPVILRIDEYDTPIQAGYVNGFYPEIIEFIRAWLSEGRKDNRHLKFALLSASCAWPKESIFSGLNNLEVYTMLSGKYHSYFRFLPEKVAAMAKDCGVGETIADLKAWYDGYRFGNCDLHNPWSVINYFHFGCKPRAYWLHTSGNEIIGEWIASASPALQDKLRLLLDGKPIETALHDTLAYQEIHRSEDMRLIVLCMTGYLRIESEEPRTRY